MGPYEIIRVVDNKAYEIALPEHMQNKGLFNVFHPWKLHLAPDNPYLGQVQEPGPAIMIWDDNDEAPHEEWEVLEIVGHGGSAKNRLYRATYTPGWDDWNAAPPLQPWTDFKNAPDKVREYHAWHPEVGPPPGFFLPQLGGPRSAEGGVVSGPQGTDRGSDRRVATQRLRRSGRNRNNVIPSA